MLKKDLHKPRSLNMDDNPASPEFAPGDFVDALNIRVGSSSEQGGRGNVETLLGEFGVTLDVAADLTTYYGEIIGGDFLYEGFEEVQIGSQVWMQKNWDEDYPGSKEYEDDVDNADTYGRLYNHSQIMQDGFCPEGYHIPTEADIDELLVFLGGAAIAGGKMKELATGHWTSPNTDATNSSGFKALPGGMYDDAYKLLQEMGMFWLADEGEPLPTTLTAEEITSESFVVNWLTCEGATGYRIDIASDESFTSFIKENVDVGNVLTYEETGLNMETLYYVRVRAYNEIGTSVNSDTLTVETLRAIPEAPVATAATGIVIDGFAANWNASDGATGYKIDVSRSADFSSFVDGYQDLDVASVLTYDIDRADSENDYYYRVRAYNASGESGNSNVITVSAIVDLITGWTPSGDELDFSSVGNDITRANIAAATPSWISSNQIDAVFGDTVRVTVNLTLSAGTAPRIRWYDYSNGFYYEAYGDSQVPEGESSFDIVVPSGCLNMDIKIGNIGPSPLFAGIDSDYSAYFTANKL